jgi:hypothetical protein
MYFARFFIVNLFLDLLLVYAIDIYFDFFVTTKFKIPNPLYMGKWPIE